MVILNHQELGSAVRDLVIDASARDRRSPGHRSLAAPIHSRGVPYSSRRISRASSTNNSSSSQRMLFSRVFEKITLLRSLSVRACPLKFPLPTTTSRPTECPVTVLDETLDALAMSAKSISSLTLGTGHSHNYDSWFRLCDLHTDILTTDPTIARVLKNINTMELGFGAEISAIGTVSKFPSQLLNLTSNLKNLELSIMPYGHHQSSACLEVFADIAASTSLTKLVKVDICATELTTQSLRAFLSASKNTLRKVRIIDVEMQENPEALKMYLNQGLTLDEAKLENIYHVNHEVWIEKASLMGGVWVQPVMEVAEG